MADPLRSEVARRLRADGWTLTLTRGGHIRATHPHATAVLFVAATPSDTRAGKNTIAQAHRILRDKGTHR